MTISLKKRIITGIGANAFGQGIVIVIQLFSLPIFLHYWNAETYGEWLILSAFPAYLSMADIGILPAAGNKLNIAIAAGKSQDATHIFQSAFIFILCIIIIFIIFIFSAVIFFPLPKILDNFDNRVAFICLCSSVLTSLFGGLPDMVYKATGRYAVGTLMGNMLRILEWGGAMIGLALYGSFSAVALASLSVRITGTFIISYYSNRGINDLKWGIRLGRKSEIRSMLKPATAFMIYPASNALTYQGMTILSGLLLGPASVTIFNTYRTLARVSVQANGILSHALWPEFSKLFGIGGIPSIKKIYIKSFWLGFVLAIISGVILFFISPILLRLWTDNMVLYDSLLMKIMICYSIVASLSHVPKVFLMSINRHGKLAIFYIVGSIFLLIFSGFLGLILGIIGFSIAMLISEIFIFLASIYLSEKILND